MSRALARKFRPGLGLAGEDGERVRQRAARAYDKYRNCGLRAAQGPFATGW